MTVGELLNCYLAGHLAGKPSAPYYARLINQVFPPLAAHDVDRIPFAELLRWWAALTDRPGHANKALGLYRAAHRWAVGLNQVQTLDQTRGLKKRPERLRCQTVSPDEWARVVPHLEDLKLRRRVAFWSAYLLADRGTDIRGMRTDELYLDREVPAWIRRNSKTGRPIVKPIPPELVPMLRLVLRTNPPNTVYVFYGADPTRQWGRTSMQKMWETLRAKAGLRHVWINDLRRSVASDLLNQGENLGVVQGALGHRSLSQTAKYAWLAVKPLARALEKRTEMVLDQLQRVHPEPERKVRYEDHFPVPAPADPGRLH